MTHTYEILDVNLTDVKEALEYNGINCELVDVPVLSLKGTAHCVTYKGFLPDATIQELVAYVEDRALLFNNIVKLYLAGRHCSGKYIIGFFQK